MSSPPEGAIVLQPAHRYRRDPPAIAGCWSVDKDILTYFFNVISVRDVDCPAEYMLHFDRAHIYDGQFVLTPAKEWLLPSITDYTDAAPQALESVLQAMAAGQAVALPPSHKPTVVIAKHGSRNYGHTLIEILPKLINIARSPLRDIRLLLPSAMAGFHDLMSLLSAALGLKVELCFEPEARLTAATDVYYFGPVTLHNRRKSATVLTLRALIAHCLKLQPVLQRKFFIDRPPSHSRSITNAPEVQALVAARGYEIVYPGEMSVPDQAALFSQASHIAGPLGAGLTNIFFAPPGCRVMMIDPGLADYFFWDLAALAGQPFSWFFTGPVSHWNQELASNPYMVNCDGLRYALDEFG